jgi:hypothetical protein
MRKLAIRMTVIAAVALFGSDALAQQAPGGPPALHPNAQAYGVKHPAATGRAGNATLQARALLDKNGTTDLNVTTGALDGATAAPGNIAKLQVKAYNRAGDVAWVQNFNSLSHGGALAYTFPSLHRGEPFQVQANVNGIDKRTDVVTVGGAVKLRPDLAVSSLSLPSQVPMGAHVNVSALVSEINDDVGAHGDCVMSVDGAQVDQAVAIWVDAGDSVTCAFNYQFNAVGTHQVSVSVVNVVPADYDTSNNSATGTIDVVNPQPPVYWWASASSFDYNDSSRSAGSYESSSGSFSYGSDWDYTQTNIFQSEGASMTGTSPVGLAFPLSSISLAMATDGTPLDNENLSGLGWQFSEGDSTCGTTWGGTYNAATNTSFYVNSWYCNGSGSTMLDYNRSASATTFVSQGFQSYWYNFSGATGSSSYSWFTNSSYGQGTYVPYGSQVTMNVSITDATGQTIHASPVIPMTPWSNVYSYSNIGTCPVDCYAGSCQQYCTSASNDDSGATGSASGVTQ